MAHDGIGRCRPRLWALDRHTALLATKCGDAKTAGHAFVRGAGPSDVPAVVSQSRPNRTVCRPANTSQCHGLHCVGKAVEVNCIDWLKTDCLLWGTNWNFCLSIIRTSPNETYVSEVRFQASLRFVLDKVALGQVLLRALLCSSVSHYTSAVHSSAS